MTILSLVFIHNLITITEGFPQCGWYNYEEFQCANGDCVSAKDICHGYPACADKSDIEFCNEDLRCYHPQCIKTCASDLIEYKCQQGTPNGHAECYNEYYEYQDGVYNCLDRSDDETLTVIERETIDYESIRTECIIPPSMGIPPLVGLVCGSQCLPLEDWCVAEIDCHLGNGTYFRSNNED